MGKKSKEARRARRDAQQADVSHRDVDDTEETGDSNNDDDGNEEADVDVEQMVVYALIAPGAEFRAMKELELIVQCMRTSQWNNRLGR